MAASARVPSRSAGESAGTRVLRAVGRFRQTHRWRHTPASASMKVGSPWSTRPLAGWAGPPDGGRAPAGPPDSTARASTASSSDCADAPPALSLQAEVRVDLFEGGFDLPAVQIPADDLLSVLPKWTSFGPKEVVSFSASWKSCALSAALAGSIGAIATEANAS